MSFYYRQTLEKQGGQLTYLLGSGRLHYPFSTPPLWSVNQLHDFDSLFCTRHTGILVGVSCLVFVMACFSISTRLQFQEGFSIRLEQGLRVDLCFSTGDTINSVTGLSLC